MILESRSGTLQRICWIYLGGCTLCLTRCLIVLYIPGVQMCSDVSTYLFFRQLVTKHYKHFQMFISFNIIHMFTSVSRVHAPPPPHMVWGLPPSTPYPPPPPLPQQRIHRHIMTYTYTVTCTYCIYLHIHILQRMYTPIHIKWVVVNHSWQR